MEASSRKRPVVVLAGASGFVGTALREQFRDEFQWVGLTRSSSMVESASEDGIEWRHCDLYSLPQVETALRGADMAVYMVHSMLPSSRLVQAKFQDLDLLLADNFIRAAERAGIRRVIYLSGLLPEGMESGSLSPHLSSRLEVEKVLQSRPVEVVSLRAGLIFGPGGSSTRMLLNLTRRLPFMILPKWTRNRTQSIDIADVLRAIHWGLNEPDAAGTYDIAGHPPMTYREMILRAADAMGRRRVTVPFPANGFALSRLWVSLISGVSRQLVDPLLESLRHSLRAQPNRLNTLLQEGAVPFEESVRRAMNPGGAPSPNPRAALLPSDRKKLRKARRVRSVQRMQLPPGWNASMVARAYAIWLTDDVWWIRAETNTEGVLSFRLGKRLTLLELSPTPFSKEGQRRKAYYISGGLLSKEVDPPGRFEFRIFPENGCLVAAIHGFAPRLPWYIYIYSQALVHLFVMKAFARTLAQAEAPSV
jgi:nucleoside-diphosphate-sugar epimerase